MNEPYTWFQFNAFYDTVDVYSKYSKLNESTTGRAIHKGENWTQNLASIYKKNIVFWL